MLIIEDTINLIADFMGYKKEDAIKEPFSQNRFKYQYTIGDSIILRLIGPELKSGYNSCMIELKGEGCREFENTNLDKSWIDLLDFFVVRLNANPTRIDLTIDDYSGDIVTLDWIKEQLDKENFITTFKSKKYDIHGNKKDGFSLEFGNQKSTQQLVIYEKLKEQIKKGIDCLQTYWLRFEMRYRKDKAYDVAMNIINLKDESYFRHFVMARLLEMLDIKEENNYNQHNLDKAKTHPLWKQFLEQVDKAKMKRYKIRKSTYETYKNYMNPKIASFFINLILESENDLFLAITKLYEITLMDFDNMDNIKLKRYNTYLKENDLKEVSLDDLLKIKAMLKKQIDERREIPF